MEKINLTVQEVLSSDYLKEHKLIGGWEGLGKECNNMVTLETPDGMNWVIGKEIVVTAGYAFTHSEMDKYDLIRVANEKGAAAVGIKTGRYFGEIDEQLIRQANAYQIPLFTLPPQTNYTTIINEFYDALFNKRNQYLLHMNEAYYQLLSLEIKGVGITEILEEVSRQTGCRVDFMNPYLTRAQLEVGIMRQSSGRLNRTGVYYYPIGKDYRSGHLMVKCDEPLNEFQENCIKYAIALINNVQKAEEYVIYSKGELHKLICELILSGYDLSDSFYQNIHKILGWRGQNFGAIYFQWVDGTERNEDVRRFIESNLSTNFLHSMDGENLVVFVNLKREGITKLLVELDQMRLFTKGEVMIGCSTTSGDLRSFSRLFQEAKLSSKESDGLYAFYEDLGIRRLLFSMVEDEKINEVVDGVLAPIDHYDSDHNSHLLETLLFFVNHNYNRKETAKALFIHVETLRYRLQKIEALTGHTFVDSDGLLLYKLAAEKIKLRS
ncbi:MAG: PucR family transcriptional regulator ligand-binding domain-containing protein [Tissierellia bacterium]|nr:PucR family transcriptional regulator ligand-binding domain-containing protein [Tissierellia bacterium]